MSEEKKYFLNWKMCRLERNTIICFFSLKNPELIFFKYEKKFFSGILESFFLCFISIFTHLFMESSVYIEKNFAILLFFIHSVIMIYTDILYKIQPSLLTSVL